jgi:hypothetical protein
MASETEWIPTVSLVTPTRNRRPFFEGLIRSVCHQTYPRSHLDWWIADDGTDSIRDLVADLPWVHYVHMPPCSLGAKRNWLHDHSSGEILVCVDDDDVLPWTRVSHAVAQLRQHPTFELAGVAVLPLYLPSLRQWFSCGPYGPSHATAASWAFRRSLLATCRCREEDWFGEEKAFTHGFTVPRLALDPAQTVLVVAHAHNSVDKTELVDRPEETLTRPWEGTTDASFWPDEWTRTFYTETVPARLALYPEGLPETKPEMQRALATKRREARARAKALAASRARRL